MSWYNFNYKFLWNTNSFHSLITNLRDPVPYDPIMKNTLHFIETKSRSMDEVIYLSIKPTYDCEDEIQVLEI
jgi:hypothetical protein